MGEKLFIGASGLGNNLIHRMIFEGRYFINHSVILSIKNHSNILSLYIITGFGKIRINEQKYREKR